MPNANEPSWLSSIYRFLRSVKLAVVLLLLITAASILATLVPQGNDLAFYQMTYGPKVAWLITGLNFDKFFSSFLFLLPAGLFVLNLGVCMVDRFVGRIRRKAKKRFGPDILHIGLLILFVGGVITFAGRQEGYLTMTEGDTAEIPGGYTMSLVAFEFLTYENGVPKDWISTVNVTKDGEMVIEEFAIEVNRPLKIGNVKLYQSSYSSDSTLAVTDIDGTRYEAEVNSIIPGDESSFIFRGIQMTAEGADVAVFDTWVDHEITGRVRLGLNENLGDYTITGIFSDMSTGLQAVIDPGYTVVFIALFIILLGLSLTYIQKIGDNKL
jgi:cytochrome c biogenesis protein ResB